MGKEGESETMKLIITNIESSDYGHSTFYDLYRIGTKIVNVG